MSPGAGGEPLNNSNDDKHSHSIGHNFLNIHFGDIVCNNSAYIKEAQKREESFQDCAIPSSP
jgi:hypothetical protein